MKTVKILCTLITICACTITSGRSALPLNQYDHSSADISISPGKTVYYIDPEGGNDEFIGTKKSQAWKTFRRVNQMIFSPGDMIKVLHSGLFHESLVLKAIGSEDMPVRLEFAAGKYQFFPDRVYKSQLHISNTNDKPYEAKAIALMFDHCRFVKVKGGNSTIIMRGKMIETFINNCLDVTISGINYDYHRPTVSELKVVRTDTHDASLQIHKDSAYEIKDSLLIWKGEGWIDRPGAYWQMLNPKTNIVSRIDIPMDNLRFSELGNHIVQVHYKKNPGFIKNCIYQSRNVERDCAGIFIQHSKKIELNNVKVFFMHGMGIVGQYSEDIRINKVQVKPAKFSGRTCSAWADILHFSGCKGFIDIRNSYLSGANDDAINVHGTYLKITKILDSNRVYVRFMNNQTFGFNPFAAGDSLNLINTNTLLPVAADVVLKSIMLNDKEVLLKLKNTIPANVHINDVAENTTATPDVWIHDNVFGRIPTRGILVTSRRRVRIERNTFRQTYMSGILINNDGSYWFESGMVKNVMINHNNFVRCGEPVIDIDPITNEKNPVHANISIIKNNFELKGLGLFNARNTVKIRIAENTIIPKISPVKIEDFFKFENCTNVSFEKNKFVFKH